MALLRFVAACGSRRSRSVAAARRRRPRRRRPRRCASSPSTAAGTCRSGRRSARASSRRTASRCSSPTRRTRRSWSPSLLDGKVDIALATIDNVVAYQEGQGEAKIADNPDLFAFMGGDGGFLSVVARAGRRQRRRPQGQDAVGRRDDHRPRVRAARARRAQRPRGDRRHVRARRRHGQPLPRPRRRQARRDAAAHAVRAAGARTAASTCSRRPSRSARTRAPSGFARRSWARDHEAALVGFLRATRRRPTGSTTAPTARSSRRCSSPTSAT